MNPFEMAAFIVVVVMVASVIKTLVKSRGQRNAGPSIEEGEVRQLRDDVRMLKERLSVLERIAVDKENSLAREIESLRDRAPM
jgi:hypothetical protein